MCIPTACVLCSELVCVQLPKSPVNAGNEALLAFAAERRAAAPCCGAAAAGRQVAIAELFEIRERTDRRTDGQKRRP